MPWKKCAATCVEREVHFENWPKGVLVPDAVGDNKYKEIPFNTLLDATYKTLRGEPDFPAIKIVPYTEGASCTDVSCTAGDAICAEELDLRKRDWAAWCKLSVFADTDGKTLISMAQVMEAQGETEDVKMKGRKTVRVLAAKAEDDDASKAKPAPKSAPKPAKDKAAQKADPAPKGTKRGWRSEEELENLLVGGGNGESIGGWDVDIPPLKRQAIRHPGYLEDDDIEVSCRPVGELF